MITKDEIERAEEFLRETDPPPLPEANGASPAPCLAEAGGFTLDTAPVTTAGAEISFDQSAALGRDAATPETRVLEAAAAQNAEIGAVFARWGNRRAAREHLRRAIEQLNEAEAE